MFYGPFFITDIHIFILLYAVEVSCVGKGIKAENEAISCICVCSFTVIFAVELTATIFEIYVQTVTVSNSQFQVA